MSRREDMHALSLYKLEAHINSVVEAVNVYLIATGRHYITVNKVWVLLIGWDQVKPCPSQYSVCPRVISTNTDINYSWGSELGQIGLHVK